MKKMLHSTLSRWPMTLEHATVLSFIGPQKTSCHNSNWYHFGRRRLIGVSIGFMSLKKNWFDFLRVCKNCKQIYHARQANIFTKSSITINLETHSISQYAKVIDHGWSTISTHHFYINLSFSPPLSIDHIGKIVKIDVFAILLN